MNVDIINAVGIFAIIAIILGLIIVASGDQNLVAEKRKKEILDNIVIREKKDGIKEQVKMKLTEFLLKTRIDESTEEELTAKLIKDFILSIVGAGMCFLLFVVIIPYAWIGYTMSVILLVYPFYQRYDDHKQFKKQYTIGFYDMIKYIILLTSGGLNISRALEEAEKLTPNTQAIKTNLSRVIKERKISGISGQNLVQCLRGLNDEFDIDEIDYFIDSIELSLTKGTSINDALKSQLSFIDSKNFMVSKDKIASTDSTITSVKTIFGIVLTLILFIAPPIITAVVQFSATSF